MSALPNIAEADIRARIGDTSFERGEEYFGSGAIFDARKQGRTLKAECTGTSAPSYRLWVTFDDQGIAQADCSCPVGSGGFCKHTAALLLTWLDRPQMFVEVEEIDPALERLSKEELIAVVKQALRRHPDLEALLETPLPIPATTGAAATESAPKRQMKVDPEVYRRQARAVFRGIDYGDSFAVVAGVADQLEAIKEIGDEFVEQQEFVAAAAVYQAVADALIENFELFDDEGGDLAGVVLECAEGLSACLQALAPGDPAREPILEALFAIYRGDIEYGGVGLGDPVPDLLVEQTTPDEKRMVAQWVRQALPPQPAPTTAKRGGSTTTEADSWASNYRRQTYGALLLRLERDTLDDEAFLRICRETGRIHDLVDRLLALGREAEATGEAERLDDRQLLGLADVFERHGKIEVVERLVRQRLQERAQPSAQRTPQRPPGPHDTALVTWLKDRYKARGDLAAALPLAQQFLRQGPSLAAYRELRSIAEPLGRWEELRPPILRQLEQMPYQQPLLTQIALDEGDIGRALALVRAAQRAESSPGGYSSYSYAGAHVPSLDEQVAKAAEETRPRDAIDIYRHRVERLIAGRGRPAYQQAAQLLRRIRDLYTRLGEQEAWARYLAALRDRNRALRAFKEELTKAGL